MKDQWTGEVLARMHCNEISLAAVAREMNVTKAYLSMILNCKRNPPQAKEKVSAAVDAIIARRDER